MNEKDLDNSENSPDKEPQVRLPWESIDPDSVQETKRSVSTVHRAVEAEDGEIAPPRRVNRLDVYEDGEPDATGGDDEWLAAHAFFSDELEEPADLTKSGSLAPVLGGEGWGEGRDVENLNPSEQPATASAEADPTNPSDIEQAVVGRALPAEDEVAGSARPTFSYLTNSAESTVEPSTSTNSPSPQPSPLSTGEREQESNPAPLANSSDSADAIELQETPWSTIDEIPKAGVADSADDLVPPPPDTVTEASVTFSTTESLMAAASELATLAESFGPISMEDAGDAVAAAPAPSAPTEGVFVVETPQAVVETQPANEVAPEMEAELPPPTVTTGGGWTIPLMSLGIGLIACCMVIPEGEANRRLRYEQHLLESNLQHVQKQVAVNDEFLKKVSDDPTLAERLAGRQMKTIRKGQTIVPLKQDSDENEMSPFALMAVAPPPPIPEYRPARGTIADLCNNARSRLYLMGVALSMVAVGLVMGFSPTREIRIPKSKSPNQ